MSRIFNLVIEHRGKSYPALLTIAGDKEDNSTVRVISSEQKIEIILPNGSLCFSTPEVLKQLHGAVENRSSAAMHITPAITLQLLKTDW